MEKVNYRRKTTKEGRKIDGTGPPKHGKGMGPGKGKQPCKD